MDEDGTDAHEERIVRKWIAQGRVKRASLSWRNTVLKCMLELSFGRLWYHTIEHILFTLLSLQHPRNIVLELGSHLANNFLGAYTFSMAPLATLLAFAIVPVHLQIVFIAAADLLGTVFVTMLIRLFGAWIVKMGFVQQYFRDGTEYIRQEILIAIDYKDALIDEFLLGLGNLKGKKGYDRELQSVTSGMVYGLFNAKVVMDSLGTKRCDE
ncbi:hypothetical protein E8E13_007673 [Curvularia kusanoi]|uniref:Uncharacterized protein n=1 Tax=Curvularia kusanoi TaxID=90978 RepID=A0A9P4T906_CURKU|nr:hypothetical protein E8E13_007673 [Curvularia kusanoi]